MVKKIINWLFKEPQIICFMDPKAKECEQCKKILNNLQKGE